jgi:hypothetical protein
MKTLKPDPSEHQLQTAVFEWAATQRQLYPELAMMFAVPNGGARHLLTGMRLKREGVKPGVPDIFLPIPRAPWHGLFVELKTKKGQISEDQENWMLQLRALGYRVLLIRSIDAAMHLITEYLDCGADRNAPAAYPISLSADNATDKPRQPSPPAPSAP